MAPPVVDETSFWVAAGFLAGSFLLLCHIVWRRAVGSRPAGSRRFGRKPSR